MRAGILRAVAGRIIKNAACSDNQSSPAAMATANIVAMASVANSSVAFIVCLPTSTHGNRTPTTNLTLLMRKDLLRLKRQTDVGTDIRRVAPDAPIRVRGNTPGMPPRESEAGPGRWPTRRFYVELLTLFFLARRIRSARGALRFSGGRIFSPPLSPQHRRVKSAALNRDHSRDENGGWRPFGVWFSKRAVVDFAFLSRVPPCLQLLRPSAFR